MKCIKNILVLISIALLFNTCKKYPQGGLVGQTRLHLFGGHKAGCSKTWKLKLYEVNGIDSTYLIQGASTIPDFYNKFVTFKLKNPKEKNYTASTFLYDYSGVVDMVYKQITLGNTHPSLNHDDSTQCKIINGTTFCNRTIFFPELNYYGKLWDIKKLTKSELILETNYRLKNSYKIILTH